MSVGTIIKHVQFSRSLITVPHLSSIRSASSLSTYSSVPPSPVMQPSDHAQHKDQDPFSLLKQDPIEICTSLWVKTFSSPPKTAFTNLTGFLSKPGLWVLAYQRSCAHFTGAFPSRDAIRANVLKDLLSLRDAVVHGRFQWNNKTNQHIERPFKKTRLKLIPKPKLPSDELCFQDRIVQEVLLMILEPVFEARFSQKSHAFRPGRNAHTVIRTIRSNFAGYLWFVKGDLSDIFYNVGVNVVMSFVENAVKDCKILGLIKSALRGQVNYRPNSKEVKDLKKVRKKKGAGKKKKKKTLNPNEPKPDPYWLRTFFSFAPEEAAKVPSYGHCGILSPLLANICLSELDNMMEDKIVNYFRPSELDSIWMNSMDEGCHNPSWPEFVPSSGREKTRRMDYIRYGGHFLIGIRGPREDAVEIRKDIIRFCESIFGLKLDNAKMDIEHISRGVLFLDHLICRRVIHPTLRYTASGGDIVSKKGTGFFLSVTASLQQCIRRFRLLELVKGDKDPEPLPCTPMLNAGQAHTNSQMNKFLETMADWYMYADNRKKVVGFFAYVIRSSLAKLYAARYKLKSRSKVYKLASRDLSQPLRVRTSSGLEYSDLLRMGLLDAIDGVQFSQMSSIPSCDYSPLPRNWIPHHEQVLYEYIKLQDPKFFLDLHRSIKQQGINLPQDELIGIVWKYKTLGVRNFRSRGHT